MKKIFHEAKDHYLSIMVFCDPAGTKLELFNGGFEAAGKFSCRIGKKYKSY
jgi:hypothetical protein